jgi:Zn-dependent protease with chaperone function
VTIAVTLALSSLLLAAVAPSVLLHHRVVSARPAVLLAAWGASMASFVVLLGSAVVVTAWPRHAPAEGMAEVVLSCLARLTHAITPWIDDTIAVAGPAALVVLTARSTRTVREHVSRRTRATANHADTVRIVGRPDALVDTVWLPHPVPLAYSIGGRAGFIVATDGLTAHLSDREILAVMAHERAHLSGGHHRILVVTTALARALALVPLFARAPAAVATLLELAADRAAVAVTDAITVRSALVRVASFGSETPAGSLALAGTALGERLAHLDGARGSDGGRSRLRCAAAATSAFLLPVTAASIGVYLATSGICTLL